MDESFIRERIAKLRTQKNISARELSLELGQSTGYINTIENGKSLPSLSMLLYICEYFNITPKEFFDDEVEYPEIIHKVTDGLKGLNEQDALLILNLVERLKE